jgi:hypothetical protein
MQIFLKKKLKIQKNDLEYPIYLKIINYWQNEQ